MAYTDGHCCDSDDVINFAGGFINAWGSDANFGAGRREQTTNAGQMGAAFGDFGASVQGSYETVVGGEGEVVGTGLALSGVGAPEGLAIDAGSAALIGHGTATGLEGATHLAMAKSSTSGENSAAAKGRAAHESYDPGPGFETRFRLLSGKQADAVNIETQTVKELKPYNPSAVAKGQRQVEGYRQELQNIFGGIWKAIVERYQP